MFDNFYTFLPRIFCLPSEIPYEMSIFTGDVYQAGTDSTIKMTVFGAQGSSGEITLDKAESRFERAQTDLIKVRCCMV